MPPDAQPPPSSLDPLDRARIEHMRNAGRDAVNFCSGRRREDLDADAMLRRALVNAVQEIGEAAARVSDAGRAFAPSLPWGQIVQMRNILVHVYWGIDSDLLWGTVQQDIPVMLTALDAALSS